MLFAQMLIELGSPAFEVHTEVELLRRPPRADVVLLRRRRRTKHDKARVLRRLWAWIDDVALVEFKSRADPVARGDLAWWLGLSFMLEGIRRNNGNDVQLKAVFVVVQRTPTLFSEAAAHGLGVADEGGGYLRLEGGPFDAMIIVLDEVCSREREPLLGLFSGRTLSEPSVQRWFLEHAGKVIDTMGSKVTQSHKEFLESFIASLPAKQRLAGLNAEQRLAGLNAEQRLAGLDAEQILRAVDAEQILRAIDAEQILRAIDALPVSKRRAIAKRLGEARPPGKKTAPRSKTPAAQRPGRRGR
jgi:hypothetical protein